MENRLGPDMAYATSKTSLEGWKPTGRLETAGSSAFLKNFLRGMETRTWVFFIRPIVPPQKLP